MSEDYREEYMEQRRVFLLRRLVELNGEANESVLRSGAVRAFPLATPEDIRKDLLHLLDQSCVTDEWIEKTIRMISLTERGEAAAYGKVAVAGVHQSRWKPH